MADARAMWDPCWATDVLRVVADAAALWGVRRPGLPHLSVYLAGVLLALLLAERRG